MAVGVQQPHPYEPQRKRFVLRTLSQTVAHAQSRDEIESGCEALANGLRIAKDIEADALRSDFSAEALSRLRESSRELRELQKGESDEG